MAKKTKSSVLTTVPNLTHQNKKDKNKNTVYDDKGNPIPYFKIQWRDKENEPQVIYLGEILLRDAEYITTMVNRLIDVSKTPGSVVPHGVLSFVEKEIDSSLRQKLIEKKLIEPTKEDEYEDALSVRQLCEIVERQFQEESFHTHKNMKLACDKLAAWFKDKKIVDITKDDIKQFNQWLYAEYAEATASRLSKRFKQIGDIGIGDGLIEINPFRFQDRTNDLLQVRSQSNKERQDYVETETVDKMIAVCVRPELRFALFLSRYMAFRIPLETSLWKWHYINFKQRIITVEGKRVKRKRTFREIPIFDKEYMYRFFAELLRFNNCESFIKDSQDLNADQIKELLLKKGNSYIKEMSARFDEGEDYVFSSEFRKRTNWQTAIDKLDLFGNVKIAKSGELTLPYWDDLW